MVNWYEKFIHLNPENEMPGWYFSDEAYDLHGPFSTKEEAIENIKNYCLYLETGVIQ